MCVTARLKEVNEYIHYIKRKIKTRYTRNANSPWFAELQHYNSGFNRPNFHVTKSTSWPANEIKNGDIIWLISELSSPWGKLPYCIDGRIEVGKVEKIALPKGMKKLRFCATKESEWFPLRDISDKIKQISIETKDQSIYTPMDGSNASIGQEFQSIKKIKNVDILHEIRDELSNNPYDFISYRITDGTRAAFFHAQRLLEEGKSIFWDRWSLPRRLAERRELVSDRALDKLLIDSMSKSETIWGIESNRYSEKGSYSNKEKEVALKLIKYKPVHVKSRKK